MAWKMHKYNDNGNYLDGKNPDVQRFNFPPEKVRKVKAILSKFHNVHPKLEIHIHTECCTLQELDNHNR